MSKNEKGNYLMFPKNKDNQQVCLNYEMLKEGSVEEVARAIADAIYLVTGRGGTNVYFRQSVFGYGEDFVDTSSHPTRLSPKESIAEALKFALELNPKKSASLIDKVWSYILADKRKGVRAKIEFHPDQDWWIKVIGGTAVFNYYETNTLMYDVNVDYTDKTTKRICKWFDDWLLKMYSGNETCHQMNSRILAEFLTNPFRLTEVCQIIYSPGGGKGKSTYTQILKELLGDMCLMDNDFELRNFTDRNTQACLRTYDELRNLKGKKIGKLNGSLTDEDVRVEMKYEHGQRVQNYGMAIITTNNLVDIDDEGRRYYFSDNKNTRKTTREFIAAGKVLGIFVNENRSIVKLTERGRQALIGWAQLRAKDVDYAITESDDLERAKLGSDTTLWNTCICGPATSGGSTSDEGMGNGYNYLNSILDKSPEQLKTACYLAIGEKGRTFRLSKFIECIQAQHVFMPDRAMKRDFSKALKNLLQSPDYASYQVVRNTTTVNSYIDFNCSNPEHEIGKAFAAHIHALFIEYNSKRGAK